jgi:hypothetical protein
MIVPDLAPADHRQPAAARPGGAAAAATGAAGRAPKPADDAPAADRQGGKRDFEAVLQADPPAASVPDPSSAARSVAPPPVAPGTLEIAPVPAPAPHPTPVAVAASPVEGGLADKPTAEDPPAAAPTVGGEPAEKPTVEDRSTAAPAVGGEPRDVPAIPEGTVPVAVPDRQLQVAAGPIEPTKADTAIAATAAEAEPPRRAEGVPATPTAAVPTGASKPPSVMAPAAMPLVAAGTGAATAAASEAEAGKLEAARGHSDAPPLPEARAEGTPRQPAAQPVPSYAGESRAAPSQPTAPEMRISDAGADDWRLSAEVRPGMQRSEPPAAQVQPQALAGQITLAVGKSADRRVEIRLDPPELGRVQIELNPTERGLQAVVLADRPETQDLLRRHAAALARDLGDAGFGDVSLDFAAGGRAGPRDEEARSATLVEAVALSPASPVAAATPGPRRIAAGGLDVRL